MSKIKLPDSAELAASDGSIKMEGRKEMPGIARARGLAILGKRARKMRARVQFWSRLLAAAVVRMVKKIRRTIQQTPNT